MKSPILLALAMAFCIATTGGISYGQLTNRSGPPTSAERKPAASKKDRALPFRGTIKSLDTTSRTFTIGERTFHMDASTRFELSGKPARLQDLKVGEYVTGSYRKLEDGQLLAGKVYVGGKDKVSSTGRKPKKQ